MPAVEFGLEIVEIIEKHYPTPTISEIIPSTSKNFAQPPSQSAIVSNSTLYSMKRQVICSACHKPGHIRMYSYALLHPIANMLQGRARFVKRGKTRKILHR